MHVQICPLQVVDATPERVWALLADPGAFAAWSDTELVRAVPPGGAVPGQIMELRTRAVGREWRVTIEVQEVEAPSRLGLRVRLPFGVINNELVTISAMAEGRSLVRFN